MWIIKVIFFFFSFYAKGPYTYLLGTQIILSFFYFSFFSWMINLFILLMNEKTLLKQRQRAQQRTMVRMKDGLRRVQINIKRANKIKSQGPTSKGICLCLSKTQGERETGKALQWGSDRFTFYTNLAQLPDLIQTFEWAGLWGFLLIE